MKPRLRAAAVIALGLVLASCQPPPRDIVVVWRNDRLVIDFPWSLWRLIGWQDREWCIDRVELFDQAGMLWTLNANRGCEHIRMPIVIGQPMPRFTAYGQPQMQPSVTYGVRVAGIGNGMVDFVLRGRKTPKIETEWDRLIAAPCGSHFGNCPTGVRRSVWQ